MLQHLEDATAIFVLDDVHSYIQSNLWLAPYEKQFTVLALDRAIHVVDDTLKWCRINGISSTRDPDFETIYENVELLYPSWSELAIQAMSYKERPKSFSSERQKEYLQSTLLSA